MKTKFYGLIKGNIQIVNNKIKDNLLIILILFAFASCTKSENPVISNKAYYNFKGEDLPRLLPYKKGQVITFKSQTNEERKFEVFSVSKDYKELYAVGMGFFSNSAASYFYYDIKEIVFQEIPSGSSFKIQFQRWPLNTELAKSNIYLEYPSAFHCWINDFPWWNGPSDSINHFDIKIKYDQIKNTMVSNGTTYKNVFTLSSYKNIVDSSGSLTHPRNVNVLYFDEQNGIIGFDDLDGKQWRIQ